MDWPTILAWLQLLTTLVVLPLAGVGLHWVRKTGDTLIALRLEVVALQGRIEERGRSLDECRQRDRENHTRLFSRLDKHGQALAAFAAGVDIPAPDLG